jgi:hypothetical protein
VENRWAGPICRLDRRNSKEMNQFSFFLFSVNFYFLEIRKNANWLKRKIEKCILPVGKIQEIEYTFSAAKEKVYSPMILKPT